MLRGCYCGSAVRHVSRSLSGCYLLLQLSAWSTQKLVYSISLFTYELKKRRKVSVWNLVVHAFLGTCFGQWYMIYVGSKYIFFMLNIWSLLHFCFLGFSFTYHIDKFKLLVDSLGYVSPGQWYMKCVGSKYIFSKLNTISLLYFCFWGF